MFSLVFASILRIISLTLWVASIPNLPYSNCKVREPSQNHQPSTQNISDTEKIVFVLSHWILNHWTAESETKCNQNWMSTLIFYWICTVSLCTFIEKCFKLEGGQFCSIALIALRISFISKFFDISAFVCVCVCGFREKSDANWSD